MHWSHGEQCFYAHTLWALSLLLLDRETILLTNYLKTMFSPNLTFDHIFCCGIGEGVGQAHVLTRRAA